MSISICGLKMLAAGEANHQEKMWIDHRGDIIVDCNITTLFASFDHGEWDSDV